MPSSNRLVFSSVLFAVLWTLGMIWWTGTETANIIMLVIAGGLAGIFWYFAMRWWFSRRHGPPA
jgi:hypothetical protein